MSQGNIDFLHDKDKLNKTNISLLSNFYLFIANEPKHTVNMTTEKYFNKRLYI